MAVARDCGVSLELVDGANSSTIYNHINQSRLLPDERHIAEVMVAARHADNAPDYSSGRYGAARAGY